MNAAALRRRPVRLFPPIGLSLLFRPLPKAGTRPTLNVTYELSKDHLLRFSAREALGIPEQTLLLAVLELVGEQYVEMGEDVTLSHLDTRSLPSRLWVNMHPDGGVGLPGTLMVRTTWEELNHRCGAKNGGSMIAIRRACLRRLCEVMVWEETLESKSVRQAFLMVWLEGDDRRVHLAVNHRLASSFLGQQYAKLWMNERLRLRTDLAMHVHAFLSAWVRQGQRYSIRLSSLASRVWPTSHASAPEGTLRRRRSELNSALREIGSLDHWCVDWSPDRAMVTLVRSETGSVRDTTSSALSAKRVSYREPEVGESPNKIKAISRNDVSALFK